MDFRSVEDLAVATVEQMEIRRVVKKVEWTVTMLVALMVEWWDGLMAGVLVELMAGVLVELMDMQMAVEMVWNLVMTKEKL